MKMTTYPYLAAALGCLLWLVVTFGARPGADGSTTIPLLTLLVVSEFAFFVTAIGAYQGIRHIFSSGIKVGYAVAVAVCAGLAIWFMVRGIELWPL